MPDVQRSLIESRSFIYIALLSEGSFAAYLVPSHAPHRPTLHCEGQSGFGDGGKSWGWKDGKKHSCLLITIF